MPDPITQEDREEIRAFYPRWTERILDGDFDGLVELYAEDAVVMAPNYPPVRGRDEVLGFMRGFPPVTRADFEVDEIEGYGDLAYVVGRYSMTLEPEGAPGPVQDEGKFIEIRRRRPDGRWLLARDIFNSNLS